MNEIVYYKDKLKCAATNLKEKENILKEVFILCCLFISQILVNFFDVDHCNKFYLIYGISYFYWSVSIYNDKNN